MEYNCEMFMDYAYEEEIALEDFHPIRTIQNVIIKLIGAIQRLLNQVRKLRKITVTNVMYQKCITILKALDQISQDELENVFKATDGGVMAEANVAGTENLKKQLDYIKNSQVYQSFVGAKNKSGNSFKADYIEMDSKPVVDKLNRLIKTLTDIKVEMNKRPLVDELKDSFKALMDYNAIHIKIYSKLLAFRKPLRDPKHIERFDKEMKGSVPTGK